MMTTPEQLKKIFPIRQPELLLEMQQSGKIMSFSAGDVIISYRQHLRSIPLLLSGAVKVMREDEEGHEVFLYYLNPGETCAMSLTCSGRSSQSQIKAVCEEDTVLLSVAMEQHEQWMSRYKDWKDWVADTYAHRFQELLLTIDNMAFRKMDERLHRYLQTKFRQLRSHTLHTTHQEIAGELGTSREVISRLLKQMEKEGMIELSRHQIRLTNPGDVKR